MVELQSLFDGTVVVGAAAAGAWIVKRFLRGGKTEQQITTNGQLETALALFSAQLLECARDRANLWSKIGELEQKIIVLEVNVRAAETKAENADEARAQAEAKAFDLERDLHARDRTIAGLQQTPSVGNAPMGRLRRHGDQ